MKKIKEEYYERLREAKRERERETYEYLKKTERLKDVGDIKDEGERGVMYTCGLVSGLTSSDIPTLS